MVETGEPYGPRHILVVTLVIAAITWVACDTWRAHTRETWDEITARGERFAQTGHWENPPPPPWPARHPVMTAVVAGIVTATALRLYLFLWRVEHHPQSPPVPPPGPRKTPPAPS